MKKVQSLSVIFATMLLCLNLYAGGPVDETEGAELVDLERIKTYEGFCRLVPDASTQNLVITSESQYNSFIERIPKYEIGMGDMPKSKDPLLKKPKINFNKYMLIVAINPDYLEYENLSIISIVRTGENAVVNYAIYQFDEYHVQQWPDGISNYKAVLVDKVKGKVEFKRFSGL